MSKKDLYRAEILFWSPLYSGGLGAYPAYRFALGGGDRIRTDDRLVANQVLYQLSYAPG